MVKKTSLKKKGLKKPNKPKKSQGDEVAAARRKYGYRYILF